MGVLLGDRREARVVGLELGVARAIGMPVAVQWSRSDEKESRRSDRHADRTGDAELEAYNAQLAAIAEHDAQGPAGR